MIHTNKRKSKDAVMAWWKPSKEFGNTVSVGLKNFFGTSEKRFWDSVTKQIDGCWVCSKKTIMENGIEYQSKRYSAKLHNLKFDKECITQKCGNPKCVNPKHLINISREKTALNTVSKRKKITRGNGHASKLSIKDVDNIKKIYKKLFKERNGKHKGIATEIHKKYNTVSLSMICQIIKQK